MKVIENDAVSFPLKSSRGYRPEGNAVVVTTQVPSDTFTFADGESISIGGTVKLKLAGSAAGNVRRRLGDLRAAHNNGDTANPSFVLEVPLQPAEKQDAAMMNAATNSAAATRAIVLAGIACFLI